MIPKSLRNLQDQSDDGVFSIDGNEIYGSFIPPSPPALSGDANQSFASQGASTAGQTVSGSVVAVTSGGITFNLLFDAAAMAAPASFRAGIQQAAAILTSAISDKITVDIKIDYSGTGGGAAAGPNSGQYESYSSIRSDLINNATAGDATFNALPSGSSIQGQSNVAVWNAQLKLWGILGANDTTTDDGSATFATDINSSLLVGVALHELTHALGRIPYGSSPDIFDLFRFTSAGTRLFTGGANAAAAYFSVDGGNTKLADVGRTSDSSDFLNSGVQGPNDPFNEFYSGGTLQSLTTVNKNLLQALGFHITSTNHAPVAQADNFSDSENTTLQVSTPGVLGNDTDSDNNSLTAILASNPSHGAVTFNANGSFIYTPAANYVGSDSFSYYANDGTVNSANPATVSITINATPLTNHVPADFNGDGHSDLLFQTTDGSVPIWEMNGTQISWADFTKIGQGNVGAPDSSWHLNDVGDFNGDSKVDLLWRTDTDQLAIWEMNGTQITWADYIKIGQTNIGAPGSDWHIIGTGDFNGDGKSDLLWKTDSGQVAIWEMNGNQITWADFTKVGQTNVGAPGSDWHLIGSADFDGDGKADLLWRTDGGKLAIWEMTGTQVKFADYINIGQTKVSAPGSDWHVVGTGDFNGDGKSDILWETNSGKLAIWELNGNQIQSADYVKIGQTNVGAPGSDWHVVGTGDYNGDGKSDILWRTDAGKVAIWEMDGMQIIAADYTTIGQAHVAPDLSWNVVQHHYDII